ncbi:hypothetical protein [Flavobacterium taihuense]|uniref:hypothetical protein n=1 Tax=Flavobacterium taihuense TaxID=2857508 RepID=UPI001C5BE1B6|nr:hypothetical protein [Flavobacterium taihuense]
MKINQVTIIHKQNNYLGVTDSPVPKDETIGRAVRSRFFSILKKRIKKRAPLPSLTRATTNQQKSIYTRIELSEMIYNRKIKMNTNLN